MPDRDPREGYDGEITFDSMLLGDDAAGSSESFVYVDMWAAVQVAKALALAHEPAQETAATTPATDGAARVHNIS